MTQSAVGGSGWHPFQPSELPSAISSQLPQLPTVSAATPQLSVSQPGELALEPANKWPK